MELGKYKEQLGEEGFAEVDTYIKSLISQKDEARAESINGRKSLKAEVEQLRTLKADLFEKLGIESVEDLATLPDAKGQAEAQKQFEARVKRLEKELATERDAKTQLDSKYRGTLTQAALQKAISAHEFVDNDLVMEYVKGRIKFENDELVYVEGDKTLSLDEGVKLISTTKPHLLKSTGTGGSGFNPNATSGKSKSFKEMTLTEKSDLYKANPTQYAELKAAA